MGQPCLTPLSSLKRSLAHPLLRMQPSVYCSLIHFNPVNSVEIVQNYNILMFFA